MRRPDVSAIGWLIVLAAAVSAQESERRVTCRVDGDPERRVYVLEEHDGGWRLAFLSRATREQWIRLALPGAEPAISDGSVTLTYRNANGGRQVDLVATSERSSLDIWVDYGLEVNIEPDLDPRIDLMNTEGPLPRVACVPGRDAP